MALPHTPDGSDAARRARLRAPVIAIVSLAGWGLTGGGQRPQKMAEAFVSRGFSVLHIQDYELVFMRPPEGVAVLGYAELVTGGLLGETKRPDYEALWARVDEMCDTRPSLVVFAACTPAMVRLARECKRLKIPVVYDILDDWEAFKQEAGHRWYDPKAEERMVRLADRVLAVSPALVRKVGDGRARLSPNAVDWRIVAAPGGQSPPADMPRADSTVVGYVGTLSGPWHDWDVVEHVARLRPEWTFVLIGPGGPTLPPSLTCLDNVHVVPPKPHLQVPPYVDCFDVGIVPFRRCQLSDAVSPLKAYDYLARGCPVVSSPMTGLEAIPNVGVAETPAEWVGRIQDAARARRERPLRWLWSNSWSARVGEVLSDPDLVSRRPSPVETALLQRFRLGHIYPTETAMRVYWRMPSSCGYRCPYCRTDREAHSASARITLKRMQEAWDRFSSDHGACHISVGGLEPMHGRKSLGILSHLSQHNTLDVNTNLAFPLSALKTLNADNVVFSVSFHPSEGVTASRFVTKVGAVRAEGFRATGASLVAYPPYLPFVETWMGVFADAGIDLHVRPCYGACSGRVLPAGYTAQERAALEPYLSEEATSIQLKGEEVRGRLCAAGWQYVLVQVNGDVYRCPAGADDLGGQNIYEGSVCVRDHPTVCPFDTCACEDLFHYHISEKERLALLGGAG